MTADGTSRAHIRFRHHRLVKSELRSLLQILKPYTKAVLAVSGGADSMALMFLARQWLDLCGDGPQCVVLTVDHGLRTESAAEAEWVAAAALKFGFAHTTLTWSGEKPRTGLQAAARTARYALMADFCRLNGVPAIACAHTQDDQAETFVMRLARGSGVDGLSGMAPVSRMKGVDLVRPLLTASRADLEALLRDAGQEWLDDPSNLDDAYERVRVRKRLSAAEKLGLTRTMLTLASRRISRARDTLDILTAQFTAKHLAVHEAGFGEIALAAFFEAPEEIAMRALSRMTAAFGGRQVPARLSKIEDAYSALKARAPVLTLGGCRMARRGGRLLVTREFGRLPRHELALPASETLEWDARFAVSAPIGGLTVRPLGEDGLAQSKSAGGDLEPVPRAAALTLPSLWRDATLCYTPCVKFADTAPTEWIVCARAEFLNMAQLYESSPKGRDRLA